MNNKNDDFFEGMLDFNGDGKTATDEEFLANQIIEETTKEETEDDNEAEGDFISVYNSAPKATVNTESPSSPTKEEAISKTFAKENYLQCKNLFIFSVVDSIIVGGFLSILPVIVMLAALQAYDDNSSASLIILLLFFGGGLAALGEIWHKAETSISQEYKNLKAAKEKYKKILSEDERFADQKKKRNGWVISGSILGLIIAVLITVSSVNFARLSNTYDEAVSLVDAGSYKEAKDLFEEIEEKNYRDTDAYISLCEAHMNYERGYIWSAYRDMDMVRFCYQTFEQTKEVESFVATLKTEYDDYLEERAEADAKAYRDRITYGVPYVGMPESEISNTSLGSPSSNVRHNFEIKGFEEYTANLYDFKIGDKTIFTARCVHGQVTEVWDHRSNPIVPYTPNKSTKPKQDDDPYNADGYANEEDFYYDHYDDFFDYEEAEDYYDEHHN